MKFHCNARTMICFGFVLIFHLVIVWMLRFGHLSFPVTATPTRYLHYVSIVQPSPTPVVPASKLKEGSAKKPDAAVTSPSEIPTPSASVSKEVRPLDLIGLRANAAQNELRRERSAAELLRERNQSNRSVEARLEQGAKQAQRSDCRTAYSSTGLLAPLFIASDLLGEKGCRF